MAKRFEVVGIDIYNPLSKDQIQRIKAKTRYLQNRETILTNAKKNYKPVDQCCCIGFHAEHLSRIAKVCKNIAEKDPTFKFRIYNSKFKQYDFLLIVFSETVDQSHKRGVWLVKKAFPEFNLCYWIQYKTEIEKHQAGEPINR